ncbi:hypothetical protein pdam_00024218 [Pocillopora damicornis]|uniref:Uncharacterized protein n=1 Tax=Pocillopora damicornis TaxID=46731 RepID=A0A3M6UTB3_POCDA|nr:hypothetical protein pdam_00024218 [Pocillopora damicornis]
MAGAILAGITRAYGNASLKISSEFHFKNHSRKAQILDPDSAEEFTGLCDRLLYSATVEGYESAKGHMDEFFSANEDRAFLVDRDALESSHCPSGRRKSKRSPKKYLEKSETNTPATRCCDTYGTTDVLRSTADTLTNAATIYTATRIPLHTGSPAISTPAFSDPPWHTTASSDALVSNFSLYSHAGAPTDSANWTSIAATSTSSILECWLDTRTSKNMGSVFLFTDPLMSNSPADRFCPMALILN